MNEETKKFITRLRVMNLKWSNAAADLLTEQSKRIEAAEARAKELDCGRLPCERLTRMASAHADAEARATALEKERDNLQARLTARAKSMMSLRKALTEVHDNIEDEGDRVYFGSTNDADTLKKVWQDLDAWNWDDIMADGKLPDVYELSREAHARATELEKEVERMKRVLKWLDRRGGLGFDAHDRISTVLESKIHD